MHGSDETGRTAPAPNDARAELTLPPAIEAERLTVAGRAGRVSYYHGGSGPPVLLVHSVNAAASAYEMRPVFEHLQHRCSTYAMDLPGFGFSERGPRHYDILLYVKAIHDLLDAIRQDHPDADGGVDVVGLSLSSEFVTRAVIERPGIVRRLVLVTPTGFRRGSNRLRAPPYTSREVPGLHAALSFPAWRDALYGLLTRRSTIRYFLERTFGSKQIDEELLDYDYLTAHQPGAVWAPLAFLCGRLFGRDMRTFYEQLEIPVWVPHATRGDFRDVSDHAWTRKRGNWTFTPLDAGALPYFERPLEFMNGLDAHRIGMAR